MHENGIFLFLLLAFPHWKNSTHVFENIVSLIFSAEFFFKYCCEQADFYNTISGSKNHDDKYNQGFKTYHEEVVVSKFVEDEEVTFSDSAVKEEFHDH